MKSRPRMVIDRAMRFDLKHARSLYSEQYKSSAKEAKIVERELKRYLVLCSLYPNTRYGMAGRVDDFWHTFLLFTREYAQFCKVVAGRFLHHAPGIRRTKRHLRQFKEDYASLWRDYPVVFGAPPPSAVWPTLEDIRRECEKQDRRVHEKKRSG